MHFAIHPPDDAEAGDGAEAAPGGGQSPVHVAFWVFDLESFTRRLETEHGVACLYPIQRLGAGSLVTAIADPDGNVVELTQMGQSWIDHLAERRQARGDVVTRASARPGPQQTST